MTRSGRENEAEMQWRQRLRCGIGERERDVYVCAEMQGRKELAGQWRKRNGWVGRKKKKDRDIVVFTYWRERNVQLSS
jgi:hypothetical protein